MEKVKTFIIGSGPADYTAAIYAGHANIQPVLYSGSQPGGQLAIATIVENFPGFHEGIDANQLMSEIREQAKLYGADPRDGSIVKIGLGSCPFHLGDERGNQIETEIVVITIGVSAKCLGLPDGEKYRGQGVSVCTTRDGSFYCKRAVAVVGGDDTACEETIYLSGLARKVCMTMRKLQLRAAEIMRKCVTEKKNIEILYNTNTLGLFDEDGVEGAHLVCFEGEENGEKFDISIDGFFLAIGHTPNTDLFKGQLEMDDHGLIIIKPKSIATNIKGVFATGDTVDPTYRQGVVAAGTGTIATIEVDRFLQEQ